MSETVSALYQDLVVERARRPVFAGEIAAPDAAADGTNPLCGDKVHVTLRLAGDGPSAQVEELRHRTRGCAICAASADLMAESVAGQTPEQARVLFAGFERLLQEGPAALDPGLTEQLGPLNAFAELHEYRSRRKCATLPWSALFAAFKSAGDV